MKIRKKVKEGNDTKKLKKLWGKGVVKGGNRYWLQPAFSHSFVHWEGFDVLPTNKFGGFWNQQRWQDFTPVLHLLPS